ncbi:hypothetical protein ES703_94808 [subsurface metagenome]
MAEVLLVDYARRMRDEKLLLLEVGQTQRTALSDLSDEFDKIDRKFVPPVPLVLYRVHKSHMVYGSYSMGKTPIPFSMLSVFLYTRKPEDYREADFDSALDFLESSEGFPSLGAALTGVSERAAKRLTRADFERRYSDRGAYYTVEGIEIDPVDIDEIPPGYEEDQFRYYCVFYRRTVTPTKQGEYWGRLELTKVGWVLYQEEPAEELKPRWDKPVDRTKPDKPARAGRDHKSLKVLAETYFEGGE